MRFRRDGKIELISRVPLFAQCTKEELAAIAHVADELRLPEGRELTREGRPGQEFVVIVDGAAEVRRGGEKLNELGPGDFLGEIALVTGALRTATVQTTAPTSVLVLTHGAFRDVLRSQPAIEEKVLAAVAERVAADEL